MQNLANTTMLRGALDEAEALCRERMAILGRLKGEDHPDVTSVIATLGSILSGRGKPDQAELLFRDAYNRMRRVYAIEHPLTRTYAGYLVEALLNQGKFAEAEP